MLQGMTMKEIEFLTQFFVKCIDTDITYETLVNMYYIARRYYGILYG